MTRQIWAINKFKQFRIVFSPSRNSSIAGSIWISFLLFFCYWIELNRHKRVSQKFSFEYFSPFGKKNIWLGGEEKFCSRIRGRETDGQTDHPCWLLRPFHQNWSRPPLFFPPMNGNLTPPPSFLPLISIIFCGNEFFKKEKKGSKRQKICTTRYFYIFLPLYLY